MQRSGAERRKRNEAAVEEEGMDHRMGQMEREWERTRQAESAALARQSHWFAAARQSSFSAFNGAHDSINVL